MGDDVGADVFGEVGVVVYGGAVDAVLVVVAGAVDGGHDQDHGADEVAGEQGVGDLADVQDGVPGQGVAGGAVEELDDGEPVGGVAGLAVLRGQVDQAAAVVAAELAGQVNPADAAGADGGVADRGDGAEAGGAAVEVGPHLPPGGVVAVVEVDRRDPAGHRDHDGQRPAQHPDGQRAQPDHRHQQRGTRDDQQRGQQPRVRPEHARPPLRSSGKWSRQKSSGHPAAANTVTNSPAVAQQR
jgi:hypothetical protein